LKALAETVRALLSIADDPSDADDLRLRKRMGVAAGYLTIFAPLGMPAAAGGMPLAWIAAAGFSVWSAANLVVLALTKRYERFVLGLLIFGLPFTLFSNIFGGGVTTGSGGLIWAFLGPAYSLLALGPRRSTPWFLGFVATVILAVAIDPLVRAAFAPPPYVVQLVFYLQNILVPLTIVFLFLRYADVRRRIAEARSEELLTNAIPASIAARLKRGDQHIADSYDATVVFIDLVGFTPWVSRRDPAEVVALLDDLFGRFDRVAAATGVEKIKTVGDAYMAVAGAPEARRDHAEAALAFARAALAEIDRWRRDRGVDLRARVGLASGPVVGGVIGERRLLFDLWGDTVNTAARMESSGAPGRIHLAASSRALLGSDLDVEEQHPLIKGLGELTTYLVR
jgi:adenylate cyclase